MLELKNQIKNYKEIIVLTGICFSLFLIHFYFNTLFSRPAVEEAEVTLFVTSINNFVETLSFDKYTQTVFYIGVLWPLIPFLELFGYTPDSIRFLMSFLMALVGPILFLTYREIFNTVRSLALTLILFNTTYFIGFFNQEMSFILLIMSICFYLSVRWYRNDEIYPLYLLGFIAGIGFYMKAIVLYPLIALFSGFIIADKKSFFERLDPKIVAITGILFILGAMPFLIYSFNTGFWYLDDLLSHPTTTESDPLEEHYGVGKGTGEVFKNSCEGFSSLIGLENNKFEFCSVIGIRFGQLLNVTENIFERFEFGSFLGGLNIFFVLTIFGLVSSFILNKGEAYAYAFVICFLLTLYSIYNFLHLHLMTLMLFYPILIGYIIDLFPAKKHIIEYTTLTLILILFLLSLLLLNNIANSEVHQTINSESFTSDDPHMVTQDEYKQFKELNLDGIVVTNFQHSFLLSQFHQDPEEVFILTEKEIPFGFHSKEKIAGLQRDTALSLKRVSEANKDAEFNFILAENKCEENSRYYETYHCGYTTAQIIENLELKKKDEFKIKRPIPHKYEIYEFK